MESESEKAHLPTETLGHPVSNVEHRSLGQSVVCQSANLADLIDNVARAGVRTRDTDGGRQPARDLPSGQAKVVQAARLIGRIGRIGRLCLVVIVVLTVGVSALVRLSGALTARQSGPDRETNSEGLPARGGRFFHTVTGVPRRVTVPPD